LGVSPIQNATFSALCPSSIDHPADVGVPEPLGRHVRRPDRATGVGEGAVEGRQRWWASGAGLDEPVLEERACVELAVGEVGQRWWVTGLPDQPFERRPEEGG
jgi:hypothetical protein